MKRKRREDVVHIYNGILPGYKKEQIRVICRDMGGPRVCHNKVSQKEKKKYCILAPVCGIKRKSVSTNLFTKQ